MGAVNSQEKVRKAIAEAQTLSASSESIGSDQPEEPQATGTPSPTPAPKHAAETQESDVETLAVSATFTVEPIEKGLNLWIEQLGLNLKPVFAPYNQVFQALLNPESPLLANPAGMNLILIRFEDWLLNFEDNKDKPLPLNNKIRKYMQRTLDDLLKGLQGYADRAKVHTQIQICPSSETYTNRKNWSSFFEKLTSQLTAALDKLSGIDLVETDQHRRKFPIGQVFDPVRNEIGHIPFTDDYFKVIATLAIRRYFALKSQTSKVFVLDCDNTLWGGVCGEVGAEGVDLSGPFQAFHQLLIDQAQAGIGAGLVQQKRA